MPTKQTVRVYFGLVHHPFVLYIRAVQASTGRRNAMAAVVASRKRFASPFLDEAFPAPPHLAKRGRFTPCAAGLQQPLAFYRQSSTSREAAASRISQAATDNNGGGGGMDECAGVLVEQMAAAADLADARSRATWILALIRDAVAERAAAENDALKAQAASLSTEAVALREENASMRTQAASSSAEIAKLREENASMRIQAASSSTEITKLREENASMRTQAAATERDNAVLKRGVVLLQARQEEEASEMKKKVAELEMANYVLTVRLRDADSCRFQAFRGPGAL